MIKKHIYENLNVVMMYCKVKIYSKNDQIITRLDEIFSHILNMN
jgi:hypothetical protein